MSRISTWLREEPVRVYMYGVAAAGLALLVFYGVITAASVPLWLGLAAAVFALPAAIEKARAMVKPVAKLPANDPDSTA